MPPITLVLCERQVDDCVVKIVGGVHQIMLQHGAYTLKETWGPQGSIDNRYSHQLEIQLLRRRHR